MDDGAVAKKQIDTPLGNVLNRMSLDQVTQKYRKSAGRVLSSEQVDRSVELLHALETTTVRQLVDCLTLG
jgi:2-methylcitrate dehydratase PrpD